MDSIKSRLVQSSIGILSAKLPQNKGSHFGVRETKILFSKKKLFQIQLGVSYCHETVTL